jgi:hypothetical protein
LRTGNPAPQRIRARAGLQRLRNFGGSYCTDTTRSSRDREVDGNVVTYSAIFARPCRSKGSRKRSSTTPNIGIAKLKGSKAKNPKASVAGSSQVGRFGCRSASHTSRRSLLLIRHSLNILRMMYSLGFACLVRLRALKVVQCWLDKKSGPRRAPKRQTFKSTCCYGRSLHRYRVVKPPIDRRWAAAAFLAGRCENSSLLHCYLERAGLILRRCAGQ